MEGGMMVYNNYVYVITRIVEECRVMQVCAIKADSRANAEYAALRHCTELNENIADQGGGLLDGDYPWELIDQPYRMNLGNLATHRPVLISGIEVFDAGFEPRVRQKVAWTTI
jgi:hypothetical protein